MKKLVLSLICISFILTSCKKDEYIKNKDSVTDTVHLNSVNPYAEYNLSDNTHLFLDATTPGAISYQWFPTNETGPVVEFSPNIYVGDFFYYNQNYYGAYKVIVTLPDTTLNYFIHIIADKSVVYCPNSFTPESHFYNKVWQVGFDADYVKMVSLNIYDNQNLKVYAWEENSPAEWDGKYNGTLCDAGYYYYIIHYTTLQGGKRSKEGILQLIR